MGEESGRYFRDLWLAFEEKQTCGAKVANAPDKLETRRQQMLSVFEGYDRNGGERKLLYAGIDTRQMKKARC